MEAQREHAPAPRPKRRLAAILSADVKGYSRLMGADEAGTVETLTAYRTAMDALIGGHDGRVVGTAGDSVLAEFPSAVEAVECGLKIQEELAARNTNLPQEKRLEFRIGINLGDVIVRGHDLFGDGVNVAARLQALAEAGGIYVSGGIYDQVRGKLPFGYEFLGEQRVKNIAEPVRVYRVQRDVRAALGSRLARTRWLRLRIAAAVALVVAMGAATGWYLHSRPSAPLPTSVAGPEAGATAESELPPPVSAGPTLLVLPFDNMSGDPEMDYFSDGITEDLTTQLALNPELRVIARNSAYAYKGEAVPVQQVAQDLGARYVLEGSVRRGGDKVRITAQLIDGATGHHVWAERYDGEGNDVFALQDEVTQKIVASLGGPYGRIRRADWQRGWAKPTASLEEYDYFMRVHGLIMKFTPEDLAEAREVALEGLERFPHSGLVRVKLGWIHLQSVFRGLSDAPQHDVERAYQLAKEGLDAKDLPLLGQWHGRWLMAWAKLYKRDYTGALAEGEAAAALAPTDTWTLLDLATIQVYAGRPEAAIQTVHRAMRQDPFFPPHSHNILGQAYYAMGRYEEAVDQLEKHLDPEAPFFSVRSYGFLAASRAALGRVDEARAAAAEMLERSPGLTLATVREREPYQDEVFLERYLAELAKVGVPDA